MLRLLHTYIVQEEFKWDDWRVEVGEEIIVTNRSENNPSNYWGYAKDEEGNLVEVKFYEWEVYNPEDENQTSNPREVGIGVSWEQAVGDGTVAGLAGYPPLPNPYPRRGRPSQAISDLTERFDEMVTRSLVATAQSMPEFPEPSWLSEAELTIDWESRPYVNTADSILREE